jgi:uncharacterized protein involved in response to NO
MNYIIKNWKTSLIGAVVIVTTIVETWLPEYQGHLSKVVAVLAGMGLLAAKDGNKTGV